MSSERGETPELRHAFPHISFLHMIDYSQYGQALILRQLLPDDTPRIVVDIGANDGICGSNSRMLLEDGWRGLLVEPVPAVFARLQANSRALPNATVLNAACSDQDGTAIIRLGKDAHGQMSSLSNHPGILANLSDESVEVRTISLPNLLAEYAIPDDFGVLLIDSEGWDLTVLRGLDEAGSKPRLIVTEDFGETNEEKYEFLSMRNYGCAGCLGSDSFWIRDHPQAAPRQLRLPVQRLSNQWEPDGPLRQMGQAALEADASLENAVGGWAWNQIDREPVQDVTLALRSLDSKQTFCFQCWRTPRTDVMDFYQSPALLMAGFRAHHDAAKGSYQASVFQQMEGFHTAHSLGTIAVDADGRLDTLDGGITHGSFVGNNCGRRGWSTRYLRWKDFTRFIR